MLYHRNEAILTVGQDYPETVAAYAWPGGYPIWYLTKDDGVLCPACVQSNLDQCCDPDDAQWFVVAHACNWEDPDLYCDHCEERIESAYAEEEEEEEEDEEEDEEEEEEDYESIQLDVCTDCLLFIANGDTPEPLQCPPWDEEDNWPGILDEWEGWELHAGGCDCEYCTDPTGENPCEQWFSWHHCEACGSHLGGDRHHATAMRRVQE